MKACTLSFAFFFALNGVSTHAATQEVVTPDQYRSLQIELPRNEVSPARPVGDLPDPDRTHLEAGVSSWMPREFSMPAFADQATAFHSDSIPGFSLALLSAAVVESSKLSLQMFGSLGAYTMVRQGQ